MLLSYLYLSYIMLFYIVQTWMVWTFWGCILLKMRPIIGVWIAAKFCHGDALAYKPHSWPSTSDWMRWDSYISQLWTALFVKLGKDFPNTAKGWRPPCWVLEGSQNDQGCARRNCKAAIEQRGAHSERGGNSHGNRRSGVCCASLLMETCPHLPPTAPREEDELDFAAPGQVGYLLGWRKVPIPRFSIQTRLNAVYTTQTLGSSKNCIM